MELGAIFLLMGVLLIVILFVAQPFTQKWRIKVQSSREVSALLAERERALTALMELDFDNGIGKIPADEYSAQRASLIQKGADILRQLDAIQAEIPAPVKKVEEPAFANPRTGLLSEEDLEELISKRRAGRQQKTAGFCPNCGKPILKSDKFCPSCGQMLTG
jgi:hypothetical protein